MKTVIKGFAVIIDDEDSDLLELKWYVRAGYVRRSGPRPNQKTIFLHKVVASRMGITSKVDHADGNTLNNSRSNLRQANHSENMRNRGKFAPSSSKYKGVYWKVNCWYAQIQIDGKRKYLGRYSNEIDAAMAYDVAATSAFGEFARPNFNKNEARTYRKR